jgi:hypothetical protein
MVMEKDNLITIEIVTACYSETTGSPAQQFFNSAITALREKPGPEREKVWTFCLNGSERLCAEDENVLIKLLKLSTELGENKDDSRRYWVAMEKLPDEYEKQLYLMTHPTVYQYHPIYSHHDYAYRYHALYHASGSVNSGDYLSEHSLICQPPFYRVGISRFTSSTLFFIAGHQFMWSNGRLHVLNNYSVPLPVRDSSTLPTSTPKLGCDHIPGLAVGK